MIVSRWCDEMRDTDDFWMTLTQLVSASRWTHCLAGSVIKDFTSWSVIHLAHQLSREPLHLLLGVSVQMQPLRGSQAFWPVTHENPSESTKAGMDGMLPTSAQQNQGSSTWMVHDSRPSRIPPHNETSRRADSSPRWASANRTGLNSKMLRWDGISDVSWLAGGFKHPSRMMFIIDYVYYYDYIFYFFGHLKWKMTSTK